MRPRPPSLYTIYYFQPTISVEGTVNAASYRAGPVSPGEFVTFFGSSIGPATGVGMQLDAAGLVTTTLAGVRVSFEGIPAPIVYVRSDQINVVVPYGVNGKQTQVVLEYQGRTSNTVTLAVAPASAGVFAFAGSGRGQGAVLNQDQTVNSSGNAAAKGSIVSLFATGAGQTDPPGIDGKPASTPLPKPRLPVSVKIAGMDAEVLYAGAAPTLVAGILQVNTRIPMNVASGSVPLVITIGNSTSQGEITITVK